MNEAREQREDEAQQQRLQKMEDLIKETLENMGRKIEQNMRYYIHKYRIEMEIPQLFSIKRKKGSKEGRQC